MRQGVELFSINSFCRNLKFMTSGTKIHLSKIETELIKNKEWILTKQSIINKVYQLFGEMLKTFKQIIENEEGLHQNFQRNLSGKISKGENYLGLPYVILDYPAFFSREKIFAIRTMFWWGNFFSISLQVSGKDFQIHKNISVVEKILQVKEFFLCVNENEWQHHFEPSNYILITCQSDNILSKILNKNFLKISKKIELDKWDDVPEFLEKTFKEIVEFIKISFPGDKKVL
jgi:hypothetical protein